MKLFYLHDENVLVSTWASGKVGAGVMFADLDGDGECGGPVNVVHRS